MGFRVLRIGIVDVVRGDKLDAGLLGHLEELLVHQRLIRQPVILQLEEIVILPEDIPVLKRSLLCLLIQSFHDIPLNFTCKTCAEGNDPSVILAQQLLVHPGPVIISFHKSFGDDLHQIGISFIVLRKKDEMIVSVIPACHLSVKPGIGRHIDLTAEDRVDPLLLRFPVEINDAVHHSVICDRGAVHPQLFDP